MPGYGSLYWAERTPASRRRRYPACRGELTADVVVIGGGLTGAMAACVLARGGLDVVLVEAGRVAGGATAASTGLVLPQPTASFDATRSAMGLRSARAVWKETRAAALDLVSAARRIGVNCEAASVPLVINATDAPTAARLRKEQASRKAAGLTSPWLAPGAVHAELGTESSGAIRLAEASVIDPVRATLGFLRAAEAAGARVFERSAVRRTKFTRKSAQVVLADATIATQGVYVATGRPGPLFAPLRRHVREFSSYSVVTEPIIGVMKRETGRRASILTEASDDGHWLRWLKDGRAMFSGAPGPVVLPRQQDKVLVQRTGQLMYELSLRYPVISGLPARWGWSHPVATTSDGLPWIGPHRNYPFHFFALALGWHGDAFGWWSAKAALRHFTDAARRGDEVFSFTR